MPRTVVLGAEEASMIGEYAAGLEGSALALTEFSNEDPELAALAGVEVAALEARSILGKGCPARVAAAAVSGREATLAEADLDGVSRLEGVVTLASRRIGACLAAMEAEDAHSGGVQNLGGLVGLATGAIGLWKAIF